MMKIYNHRTGSMGEEIAKKYLRNNGYRIMEENYRRKSPEIDLIAKKNRWLIFIEVKTRSRKCLSRPEEIIGKRKIERIKKGALIYAVRNRYKYRYRIDAICVVFSGNTQAIILNHYKNIAL